MTLLATETFTAADGTLITARPCDTGQTWAKQTGSDTANFVIQSGAAQLSTLSTTGFTAYDLGVSLGNADYSVGGTVHNLVNDAVGRYDALFLRSNGTGTYYECRRDTSSQEWFIARKVASVETTLVTTSGVPGAALNDITVSFSVSGSGATVSLSATIAIPAFAYTTTITFSDTDATRIVSIGAPGIGIAELSTSPLGAWDDISVDGTSGATALPALFHRSQTFSRRRR